MTSLERMLTTLQHKEPDRVPLFLTLTLQGAKTLGMGIREYFSRPENVVEGQLRKRAKYRDDIVTNFFYGAIDAEPFGSRTRWFEDGPPNAGEPCIRRPEDILRLEPPKVAESASLQRVLRATELLKERIGDDALILGIVISPFGLPVMQMGFGPYIELIYERPELFERLMQVNEAFCVEYANAQLAAGCHAIGYFDPVSTATIIPPELYRTTGLRVANRVLSQLNGPTVTLLASGDTLPMVDDVASTGTLAFTPSPTEDLAEVKRRTAGKIAIIGNLNGVEMRTWSPQQAAAKTEAVIRTAGPGGGLIVCDAHGEIPWQVPEDVLEAIAETVHEKGRYPLGYES